MRPTTNEQLPGVRPGLRHGLSFLVGALLFLLPLSPATAAEEREVKLVKGEWLEISNDHFVVITDAGEKYARAFIDDLDSFRQAIPLVSTIRPRTDLRPLTVVAVHNRTRFRALQVENRMAGFFMSSLDNDYAVANLSGYDLNNPYDDFERFTLLHEYVHHLMRVSQGKRDYPLWYSEGLADFLSTIRIEGTEIVYGRANRFRAYTVDFLKVVDGVEDALNTSEYPGDHFARSAFYGYSWLIVHYVYSNPDYRPMQRAYLEAVSSGADPRAAFTESFGMSYREFGTKIKNYENDRLRVQFLDAKGSIVDSPELMRELSASEVASRLGALQLARAAQKNTPDSVQHQGQALIEYSIELDPSNLSARTALLRERLEGGYSDELHQQILQLYRANPKDGAVSVLLGDSLVRGLEAHPAEREPRVREARVKYRRAIALDGNDLRAMVSLHALYDLHSDVLVRGDNEMEERIVVTSEMFRLTFRYEYLFQIGEIYQFWGRPAEAISYFEKAISSPDRELADRAADRMAQLESSVEPQ